MSAGDAAYLIYRSMKECKRLGMEYRFWAEMVGLPPPLRRGARGIWRDIYV